MPDVLVVDDEANIRELVSVYLTAAGYSVSAAADGTTAVEMVHASEPDLVVLDIGLPGMGGAEVCSAIREFSAVPIVMLTARDTDMDKVALLEAGADDYVVKPFSPPELVARVRAILRRTEPRIAEGRPGAAVTAADLIEVGGLRLDVQEREVNVDGAPVALTAREFDLLLAMARRPGVVFSREQLLESALGFADYSEARGVDVHVRHLREKLGDDASTPRFIETVRGSGLSREARVKVSGDADATTPPGERRRSVATRARLYLVGAAMLALVVAFGVFTVAWGQYSISQRSDELGRQVTALAKGQAVSESLAGGGEASATAETRSRLLSVQAGLMGAALLVTDASGTVQRATNDSPPVGIPLSRLTRATSSGAVSGVLRSATGARLLVVSAAIDQEHRLVAVQGLREIRQTQVWILAIGVVALVVAAIVAYVAGGVLAKRLTAPLVRLEGAAESVADGAFGTQVAEEGDVETASLARSFNRMSTRVADAYAAQKAFVGDVSHEIRTPLTSIRGFAEALLDGTVTDPEQQRRALGVIRDEAVRIGEVSQTLLALSELEAGAVEVGRSAVDVVVMADALRGRFSAAAIDAGVRLEIDLPEDRRPLGDPERLMQATSALLANAIAYTPRGGDVRVSTAVSGGRWLLRVDDSGPGIPAEKRGEVFGRFSRLGNGESGGSGLGLAICKRLVELMGGEVRISDSTCGGAQFEIDLPRAPGQLNTNST